MSPWSACVGDGETTCSTIHVGLRLDAPGAPSWGTTTRSPSLTVRRSFPATTSPSPPGCRGRRARPGAWTGMNCPRGTWPARPSSRGSRTGAGRTVSGRTRDRSSAVRNTGSLIVAPPGTGFPRSSLPPCPRPVLDRGQCGSWLNAGWKEGGDDQVRALPTTSPLEILSAYSEYQIIMFNMISAKGDRRTNEEEGTG